MFRSPLRTLLILHLLRASLMSLKRAPLRLRVSYLRRVFPFRPQIPAIQVPLQQEFHLKIRSPVLPVHYQPEQSEAIPV